MTKLKRILVLPLLLFFIGCNDDSDVNLEGVTVDLALFQALADIQGGDISQTCGDLLTEFGTFGEVTVSLAENGVFSDCTVQSDWKSSCTPVGTYSGNSVTLEIESVEVVFTVNKVDDETIRVGSVTADGQEIPLDQFFEDEDERTAKFILEEDVDSIATFISQNCLL